MQRFSHKASSVLEKKIYKGFPPYKCIGKQTWPCRKKVKCQYMTFILAILVDPHPQWFKQRFSPKAFSVLEKIFKGFYHIWAWWPSWSTSRDHFSNLPFPQPKEAPYEIWAKLAQRRSRLKFWIFFPYKCIRKQNWSYRKKVKCQCMTIILSTLVDLPFLMIYAKIQPQGILGFEEKDF